LRAGSNHSKQGSPQTKPQPGQRTTEFSFGLFQNTEPPHDGMAALEISTNHLNGQSGKYYQQVI
jgi:hypothetical protein